MEVRSVGSGSGVLDRADVMLVELVESCWKEEARERPSMSDVLECLQGCLDAVAEVEEIKKTRKMEDEKKEEKEEEEEEEEDEEKEEKEEEEEEAEEEEENYDSLGEEEEEEEEKEKEENYNAIAPAVSPPPPSPPPPSPPSPLRSMIFRTISHGGTSSVSPAVTPSILSSSLSSLNGHWTCSGCTLLNEEEHLMCAACGHERPLALLTPSTSKEILFSRRERRDSQHRERSQAVLRSISATVPLVSNASTSVNVLSSSASLFSSSASSSALPTTPIRGRERRERFKWGEERMRQEETNQRRASALNQFMASKHQAEEEARNGKR